VCATFSSDFDSYEQLLHISYYMRRQWLTAAEALVCGIRSLILLAGRLNKLWVNCREVFVSVKQKERN